MIPAPKTFGLVLLVFVAGCAAPPEGGDGATTTSPTTTAPPQPTVQVTSFNATVNVGQAVHVTWDVDPGAGRNLTIPHTAVHYADFRVANPTGPADYGNNSNEIHSGSVPDTFNATFTASKAGDLYFRAHAVIEGENYWSEEKTVGVLQQIDPDDYLVQIGTQTSGSSSNFDPPTLTISAGDRVRWENLDALAHTATSDEGTPESFDTGPLLTGSTSNMITFSTPGTYTYHCSFHPSTMTGARIIVEA